MKSSMQFTQSQTHKMTLVRADQEIDKWGCNLPMLKAYAGRFLQFKLLSFKMTDAFNDSFYNDHVTLLGAANDLRLCSLKDFYELIVSNFQS